MRILLINKYFFLKGGAERAFFEMDAALREAGHETMHFALRDVRNRPSPWSRWFASEASFEGPVWRAATLRGLGRMFYSREVRQKLRALVEHTRPDAAVIHNAYHQLGPAVLLELGALGVPTLMVLHDYKVVCPAYTMLRDGKICHDCAGRRFHRAARHGCGGSRTRGAILAAESYWQWEALESYERVAAFAAPSRYLAEAVAAMGFPWPVRLLRNGLALPERPNDPSRGDAVGFAGRWSSEKGLPVLLEAARRLPGIPFRLAGDGPLRGLLESAVGAHRMTNVTLLGHLDDEALDVEMRRWRVAIVPSVWAENSPYAVLEPMARAIPVVASRLGGVPELLEGRGLLVPHGQAAELAEAIEDLWGRPERAGSLGQAGREWVARECTRGRLAAKTVEMLRSLSL